MLIPFLAIRNESRALANLIGRSLIARPQDWEIKPSDSDGVTIESIGSPDVRLVIHPRRIRLFDEFHLFVDPNKGEAEIWLPLLARLRLRNIVRLFAAERAREAWDAKSHG